MSWNRRQIIHSMGILTASSALIRAMPAFGAEPFRIGAMNDVTGAGSPYGSGMQKSIIFSSDEVNAAGGAAGAKLEVLAEDSQTSPEAGVLAAKKLIEVNKVRAILGTWSSVVTLAVAPILEAANVIHMTNAGTSALMALNKKGLIFRYSSTSERTGQSLAAGALDQGLQKIAVMAINNASGREVAQGAADALKKAGKTVLTEVIYEPNQPSYRSEIQRALSGGPQVIVMGSFLPDMTVIAREVRQSGSDVKFIAPAWAVTPKLIDALGAEASEGIMSADYVSSLQSAGYAHFKQRYKDVTGADADANYYASCAYDMVQCLALAIEAAGPGADNAAIAAKMRQVGNPPGKLVFSFAEGQKLLKAGEKINYEGASGPLDFDEQGNVKALFKLSIVKNGKIEFVRVLA